MTTELAPELIRGTGTLTIEDIDVVAATGNAAFIDHVSDIAADAAMIAQSTFTGDDSLAAATIYAATQVKIVDNTTVTQDGSYTIRTIQGGTLTDNAVFALGLAMNGATGGDQGAGTINATGLFIDGVAAGGAGDMLLGTIQTVTAAKTFNTSTLLLDGATSGVVTLDAAAIAGAGVMTVPAGTDTLVALALTQSLTNKSMDNTNTIDLDALENMSALTVVGNSTGAPAAPGEITIIDDDSMATATATNLATAESIKAYADSLTHQSGAWSLQLYTDPTDFTAGSTTGLTMPVASASNNEANVQVYFNGLWQQSDQWTIAGTAITFGSAIPVGVDAIEIRVFTVS